MNPLLVRWNPIQNKANYSKDYFSKLPAGDYAFEPADDSNKAYSLQKLLWNYTKALLYAGLIEKYLGIDFQHKHKALSEFRFRFAWKNALGEKKGFTIQHEKIMLFQPWHWSRFSGTSKLKRILKALDETFASHLSLLQFQVEKFRCPMRGYLALIQNGRCPATNYFLTSPKIQTHLHHTLISNTKQARKSYPILIDSVFNLTLLEANYHIQNGGYGKLRSVKVLEDLEALLRKDPLLAAFAKTPYQNRKWSEELAKRYLSHPLKKYLIHKLYRPFKRLAPTP